jgi:hypothetical protein
VRFFFAHFSTAFIGQELRPFDAAGLQNGSAEKSAAPSTPHCFGLHPREYGGAMVTKNSSNGRSHGNSGGRRKWSAAVDTDSTHPRSGLFSKDAKTIARELASRKVSPKGPSSGMRMLTFYINRAGKNLPPKRLKVLENAKQLLHEQIAAVKAKEKGKTNAA